MNRHASACARTIPHRQPTAKPPCLLSRPRSSRSRSASRLSHLRNSQVAVQARYSRQATATALVAVTGSSRGPAARAAASSIHAPCVNPGLPAVPSPNPSRPGIMAPDPPAPSRGRNRPTPPDLSRAARGKRARPADTSDARLPDARSCQAPAARCRIPSLHLSGPPLRAAPPCPLRAYGVSHPPPPAPAFATGSPSGPSHHPDPPQAARPRLGASRHASGRRPATPRGTSRTVARAAAGVLGTDCRASAPGTFVRNAWRETRLPGRARPPGQPASWRRARRSQACP